MHNKKGQIGETTTWIVATLIIIVILSFTIFLATNKIKGDKEIRAFFGTDSLASKSFFSYLLSENEDGEGIYSQLQASGDFNEFNGNLALEIFENFYDEDYMDVWVGVMPALSNTYFGRRPTSVRGEDITFGASSIEGILERVKLNEDKIFELYLLGERKIK